MDHVVLVHKSQARENLIDEDRGPAVYQRGGAFFAAVGAVQQIINVSLAELEEDLYGST